MFEGEDPADWWAGELDEQKKYSFFLMPVYLQALSVLGSGSFHRKERYSAPSKKKKKKPYIQFLPSINIQAHTFCCNAIVPLKKML